MRLGLCIAIVAGGIAVGCGGESAEGMIDAAACNQSLLGADLDGMLNPIDVPRYIDGAGVGVLEVSSTNEFQIALDGSCGQYCRRTEEGTGEGPKDYTFESERLVAFGPEGSDPTTLSYDSEGRLIRWTRGSGTTWAYEYDEEGRWIGDDSEAARSLTYDAAGLLVATNNAYGDTITYSYDPNGRVRSKTSDDDGPVYYEYDDSGRLLGIALDPGASPDLAIVYDDDGRVVAVEDPQIGEDETVVTYDEQGRLATLSLEPGIPGGDVFTFLYGDDCTNP